MHGPCRCGSGLRAGPSFSSIQDVSTLICLTPPLPPPIFSGGTSVVTRCPTNLESDLASTRPSLSPHASLASIAGLVRRLGVKTRSRTGHGAPLGVTSVLAVRVVTRRALLQLLRPPRLLRSMRPSMPRKASSMWMSRQSVPYGQHQPVSPPSMVLISFADSKSDQRGSSEVAIGTSTGRRRLPARW